VESTGRYRYVKADTEGVYTPKNEKLF